MGWGSLRGLVLAGCGGLSMVNMNVGWLTDGWMDGWTDGLTTPQQLRTELLDPRVRCISAHFERSTYLYHFFISFSPDHELDPPSSPFLRALHLQPAFHQALLVSLNPFFWIREGPAERSFCLFSNTPSCTHSALAVDARLAREPGLWHLYRARLKHERVDISRRRRA